MIAVIDASVTLGWILSDEQSGALDALFGRIAADGAVVPSLWRLEIANALQMGIRR